MHSFGSFCMQDMRGIIVYYGAVWCINEMANSRLSVLLLTSLAVVGSSGRPECSSQQYLTDQEDNGARFNPPLVFSVRATSYAEGYPTEEIFAFDHPSTKYTWCSDGSDSDAPNITINMTEPVLLYGLLSGGYSFIILENVTAFSLDYSETDGAEVVPYQLQSDTLVFNVPGPDVIPLVLLPRPIVAKILYFHVINYVGSAACWTLALIGCRLTEAIEEELTVEPTPSPSQLGGEGGGEDNSQAVITAVATAVVTVLAVAVIVAVGVALCWGITNGHIFAGNKKEQRERSFTLRTVENELYTDPTSSNNNAGQLQVYEPIQPGSGGGGRNSMLNNPCYYPAADMDMARDAQQPLTLREAGYEGQREEEYSYVTTEAGYKGMS